MQTKIQKWGNSLGLRIPKAFAEEAGVRPGSTVDLSIEDGKLVIQVTGRERYDLDELLSQVTSENTHTEVSSGEPLGQEAW